MRYRRGRVFLRRKRGDGCGSLYTGTQVLKNDICLKVRSAVRLYSNLPITAGYSEM